MSYSARLFNGRTMYCIHCYHLYPPRHNATTSDADLTPDCCPNTQHTYPTVTFLHACYMYMRTHIRFLFHNTRIFIYSFITTHTYWFNILLRIMPICILLYTFHLLQLRSVNCLNIELSIYLHVCIYISISIYLNNLKVQVWSPRKLNRFAFELFRPHKAAEQQNAPRMHKRVASLHQPIKTISTGSAHDYRPFPSVPHVGAFFRHVFW